MRGYKPVTRLVFALAIFSLLLALLLPQGSKVGAESIAQLIEQETKEKVWVSVAGESYAITILKVKPF